MSKDEQDAKDGEAKRKAEAEAKKKKEPAPHSKLYELTAVCFHMGYTAFYGHYVCWVKDTLQEKWYSCNDTHKNELSGS